MTLPVLILLERHWDSIPQSMLQKALSRLIEKGYDTICYESASDDNNNMIINQESTIKFIKERYQEATNMLYKKSILHSDLTKMNYSDLERLLYLHASSKYSKEMAMWFRELPGHIQKLALMNDVKSKNMNLMGIDLNQKELEPLSNIENQFAIKEKIKNIDLLDEKRITSFFKNIKKLQSKGNNVVFVVGQVHYEKLVKIFDQDLSSNDVIFLHPFCSQNYDSSMDDRKLSCFSSGEKIPKCSLVEREIKSNEDMSFFINLMFEEIEEKISCYKEIDSTQAIKLLSNDTKLSFKAFLRPSYYVDAYHFFEGKENKTDIEKLEKLGFNPKIRFFDNKKTICISNINEANKLELSK